jgi:hypothetical protein
MTDASLSRGYCGGDTAEERTDTNINVIFLEIAA